MFAPILPPYLTFRTRVLGKKPSSHSQNSPELNKRLCDYVFHDKLGQGAYGNVLLAKTPSAGDKGYVAVKVIRRSKLVRKSTKALLATEVESLRQLTATGSMFFTQLHEAFCDGHNYYIVTDFLCGGTLRDEMKAWGSKMQADRVLLIMSQLVEALSQLRTSRIIHRDLKPENILLDALGNITIADFGMSRNFEAGEPLVDLTEELEDARSIKNACGLLVTNAGCGTLGYVAPEMLRGEFYSFQIDVYAVGVILYEMLFAQLPFPEKPLKKLLEAVDSRDWTVPAGFEVDPIALDMLRSLLAKHPFERVDLNGIKRHAFFKDVDWAAIAARSYDLPKPHEPFLKPLDKTTVLNVRGLIDPKAVTPDVRDAGHSAVNRIDAVFNVTPSGPLAARPETPRAQRSRVNNALHQARASIVDRVLGRMETTIRRRPWLVVDKPYVKGKVDVAATMERVDADERRAGAPFSAFDCSIVLVGDYDSPIVEARTQTAVDQKLECAPAPASIVSCIRPGPLHISIIPPAFEFPMSPPITPSPPDASHAFAQAFEPSLPFSPRPMTVYALPSLAISGLTLPSTPGPTTPTRRLSYAPELGGKAKGESGIGMASTEDKGTIRLNHPSKPLGRSPRMVTMRLGEWSTSRTECEPDLNGKAKQDIGDRAKLGHSSKMVTMLLGESELTASARDRITDTGEDERMPGRGFGNVSPAVTMQLGELELARRASYTWIDVPWKVTDGQDLADSSFEGKEPVRSAVAICGIRCGVA
ncbi:hypothetical protein EW145_g7061 [Phellinidium pouzarii]|uniref:Protein kinase domain-containing protein n=1 Tax=Phellinidium pouzarii TaxID=167371 RepID=A0A4S4KU67_9AGAM|nr:hypothetical protein EW145_g7061 [Phellinidium pouzarii]